LPGVGACQVRKERLDVTRSHDLRARSCALDACTVAEFEEVEVDDLKLTAVEIGRVIGG
jgi:hypothetical protein